MKDVGGQSPGVAPPSRARLAAEGFSNAYVLPAVALLTIVGMLNSADRVLLGVLAEPIRHDLGLSDSRFGLLAGLFYAVTYTAFALPVAQLAERRGRNRVLGLCVGVWSLATACSGLATSFLNMSLARIAVAAGEAASTPILHSLVGQYVSVRFRSRALACIGAGAAAGGVLGFALGGTLGQAFGWRSTFLIVGLPGLALGLLAAVFLKEPRKGAAKAVPDAETPALMTTVRSLVTNPLYIVLVLVSVLCVMGSIGLGTWAAAYLMRAYHVSIGTAGATLGLSMGLAGMAGMFLGGALGVKAADGAGGLRIPAAAVILGGIAFMVAISVHHWGLMVAGLAIGSIGVNCWYAPVFSAVQSIVRPTERGQAVAVLLILNSSLGAGLGPSLVGFASDFLARSGGGNHLQGPLLAMGGVVVVGGVLLVVADVLQRRGARATDIDR
jgi:predicted MFS family arabinose efflux permease